MLVRSKAFWLATVLFLLVGGGLIWLVFPPILRQLQAQKKTTSELDAKITNEQAYLANIKQYNTQSDKIGSLYSAAATALPTSSENDLLLLQLDGLLNSLGLANLTIATPVNQTSSPSSSAPAGSDGEVKAGGSTGGGAATSSEPIVKSEPTTNLSFTLTGEADFGKTRSLVVALRHFARWNKLSSLSVSQSGGKTTLTLSSDVFTKKEVPKDFSAQDSQLVTNADKLFADFKSYSSTPDIKKEGSFGRSDPFAAP